MRTTFWPFSRKSAFVASLVLVPAFVAIVVWLADESVADFEISPWVLVLAVLVGLVPVILVVLGGVDTLEAGRVKVAFAAVQEVVATASDVDTRSLLAHNLGDPRQVRDSGSDTVIETLASAVGNEVVEIALKEGEAWWETRLLLLAAGATRLQNPKAVAFTWATPDRARTFIGWAKPADIQRRLLTAHEAFREAYEKAERDTLLHRLSSRAGPDAPKHLPWAPAGKATVHVAEGEPPPAYAVQREDDAGWEYPWPSAQATQPPWTPDDRFLPERLLLDKLADLETPGAQWRITESRLRDLLGSVLFTDSVDRNDSEERWIATIVGSTADYFALTSGGQLVNLISRPAALNAVLLTLLRQRGGE